MIRDGMKFKNGVITIGRELSELDKFTLDFIKVLNRLNIKYVLISGYVSILLGRSRSSEDIDIIIEELEKEFIDRFKDELKKNDFYCLNADDDTIYDYLSKKTPVRFAKENNVIPNMEMKFPKDKIDNISMDRRIKVVLNDEEIYISQLDLQIAFKEEILKSPKDMEDAKHIREVAKDNIDDSEIERYKEMLHGMEGR